MLPSIFGENLFDDWFSFPNFPEVRDIERKLYGRRAAHEMKTDVREHENGFEVDIDLPGYQKDEIAIHLEKGVLTVSAEKQLDKETENKAGQAFFDAKISEIVSIFTPAPPEEQKEVYLVIKEVSPANVVKLQGFNTK